MRIAFIHPALAGKGGGERQLLNLAVQLQKRGHEVEIFTRYVDPVNCYLDLVKQVKIKTLSSSIEPVIINKLSFHLGKSKILFRAAIDIGKNYKDFFTMVRLGLSIPKHFDIINCHNFPTEWAAFVAKQRIKTPIVWHCNEPPFWFYHKSLFQFFASPLYRIWDEFVVKHIDLIITLDELSQKRVKEIYSRDSLVIRSGVDVLTFKNKKGNRIRERYGLSRDDFVLLQVGALNHYKRQVDSISALRNLNLANVKLILVGEGNHHEVGQLKGLTKRLRLVNQVIFAGQVTEEELPEYYAACDAFLFPAEQTWGLVVIEAMASAKPVIVSSSSGVAEVIEDRVTGLCVSPRKPGEIADKILVLYRNPELRKAIGEKAQEFVRNSLSWERFAMDCENVFQKVLQI